MKRTTVSLSEELVQQLEREAKRLDTSASAIVRTALNEHLSAKEGKREIPFAALGSSGDPHSADRVEEWLKESGFGEDSFGR